MSVLAVVKVDIRPEKAEAVVEWTKTAIPTLLGIPGLVELRSFRSITGSSQAISIYEFADLAAYAAWRSHAEAERLWIEAHTYMENISVELWGPSPVSAGPLRPA